MARTVLKAGFQSQDVGMNQRSESGRIGVFHLRSERFYFLLISGLLTRTPLRLCPCPP